MRSGCNYVKWALLPILVHEVYKNTILFVSGIKNLGNSLTYGNDEKNYGNNSGILP